MAKATLKTDWAPTLRAAIKDAGVPRGWSVYQRNGNTRLRVRTGAGGKSCWSKDLPIAWAISNIAAITKAVAELHTFTTAGTGQLSFPRSRTARHSNRRQVDGVGASVLRQSGGATD